MRGLHPQGHVTRQYRDNEKNKKHLHFHKAYGPQAKDGGGLGWENPTHSHVKNQRRYVSTFTRSMDPKRSRVVT